MKKPACLHKWRSKAGCTTRSPLTKVPIIHGQRVITILSRSIYQYAGKRNPLIGYVLQQERSQGRSHSSLKADAAWLMVYFDR